MLLHPQTRSRALWTSLQGIEHLQAPLEGRSCCQEVLSGGPRPPSVCGAGGRPAHIGEADERLRAEGLVCACSLTVRIHPAESLAFIVSSLLRSHPPTCFSPLELILLQQELYSK